MPWRLLVSGGGVSVPVSWEQAEARRTDGHTRCLGGARNLERLDVLGLAGRIEGENLNALGTGGEHVHEAIGWKSATYTFADDWQRYPLLAVDGGDIVVDRRGAVGLRVLLQKGYHESEQQEARSCILYIP